MDLIDYTKKLEDAGLSRTEAQSHIQVINSMMEGKMVTKQDLKETELNLKKEFMESIENLRKDFEQAQKNLREELVEAHENLKTELKIWMQEFETRSEQSFQQSMKELEIRLRTDISLKAYKTLIHTIVGAAAFIKILSWLHL